MPEYRKASLRPNGFLLSGDETHNLTDPKICKESDVVAYFSCINGEKHIVMQDGVKLSDIMFLLSRPEINVRVNGSIYTVSTQELMEYMREKDCQGILKYKDHLTIISNNDTRDKEKGNGHH